MIRYTLVCDSGHDFESWFPSSESYDDQAARGFVTCPVCASAHVVKGMMAPALGKGSARPPVEAGAGDLPKAPEPMPMTAEPGRQLRAMLRAVREHVTRTADDVGARFPEEARRMHYGETEIRPIYGEASRQEARALVEEGIAVSPLPPMPDERH